MSSSADVKQDPPQSQPPSEPPIKPLKQNSHLSLFKQRSDASLRSSQSDLDSLTCSESKRVSFNTDVRVKKIPKTKPPPPPPPPAQPTPLQPLDDIESGPFARVTKQEPPANKTDIANETNLILRHLEGLECSVSASPGAVNPPPTILPASQGASEGPAKEKLHLESSNSLTDSGCNSNSGSGSPQHSNIVDQSSSAEQESSFQLESDREQRKRDNTLYGLHALNNLDIAVNGKNVNSMPSYQEIRRTHAQLDSSGGSGEYSPPLQRSANPLVTPPKPPRKAPSISPPSVRRSMAATTAAHYSHPERSSHMVSSMMDQFGSDNRYRRRMGEISGDEEMSSSNITSSYSSRNAPQAHGMRRNSPPSHMAALRRTSVSPSRLSPSRTCMTDTEILRSPAEVLYAVSDKQRSNGAADRVAHSASQTMHSELQQRAPSTYSSYTEPKFSHSRPRKPSSRMSSREDLLSDVRSSYTGGPKPGRSYHPNYHRSLERGSSNYLDRDANKENKEEYKARILVTSPDRMTPERDMMHGERKPYKTTINTANDNIIQYRGSVRPSADGSRYQKNQLYKRHQDTEHYKVPKSKAPVEYLRNGRSMHTDSDHSSVYYNGQPNGRAQFASTRLVKNADTGRRVPAGSKELDREGRTIRRIPGEGRGRTYSGCSTSPDREGSPDRYARPKPPIRSYSSMQHRSPSTSPTRPPRSRSSPGREMISNVVRRMTSRREVERTPSTRATATSRSPIKEIKRERMLPVARERSGDRHHIQQPKLPRNYDESEERLARFTEYRGEEPEDMETDVASSRAEVPRRSGSVAYDPASLNRRRRDDSGDESRERGRSLPPGANIDSMRDFYKSSQFKSMYALPPSPSRPAPVLERAPSASTLLRRDRSKDQLNSQPQRPPQRPNRVSISEGEVTDDPARQERIQRHRNKFLSQQQQPVHHATVSKRPSTKRPAPSPPGHPGVRRVVSSDREEVNRPLSRADQMRRVVSTERGLQHPPARRPVGRKSSVGDALDSSYSESEGPFNGDPEQRPWSSVSEEDLEYEVGLLEQLDRALVGPGPLTVEQRAPSVGHLSTATTTILHLHHPKERRGNVILYDKTPTSSYTFVKDKPLGEFGRRWAHSDIDSDYRRELATNGNTSGLHQEARGRDGGSTFATLKRNGRDSDASPVGRSSSSAREEERRKVLEIEEERVRREREAALRRPVTRSGSRVSRASTLLPRSKSRQQNMPDDHDSQYSGHSSSSAMRKEPLKPSRFDQNRMGRVKRSTSSATNNTAISGVRRELINRKKLPGSVTSSMNSSESEQGSQGVAPSTAAANGNRSVFLHAACVADIPPNSERKAPPRALSAESRTNLAGIPNGNGHAASQQSQQPSQPPAPPPPSSGSNLQKSKKISRSISLLAPWKPKQVARQFEIHYDNSAIYGTHPGKPPRPPPVTAATRKAATMQRDKKSASSSDLLRDESSAGPMPPTPHSSLDPSSESGIGIIGEQRPSKPATKVSRSVSMPKDTRLAGWFRKRKRS